MLSKAEIAESVGVSNYTKVMLSDLCFQFKIINEVIKVRICYNERINSCLISKWRRILFSSEKTYFHFIKEVI